VGFHLTEASLTIDLDRPDLPPADLLAAETLANQIIIEDRPLRAWFPDESERAALDLRQRFQVEGPLRVVEIADFDACACGGTHVSRTGEIGQIKITKVERAKKATRLEFKCGWRALADYREKHQALMTLAGELTVGYWQVAESVLALREDNKTLQKELHTAQARLLDYEAEELWRSTPPNEKGQIIIRQVWEGRPAGDLNKLALALSQKPGTLALLASSGEKAALVIAATEGSGWDAAALLKVALAPFGAKGGGRPTLAQGGGFPATAEQLRAALNFS
jgi:alanyl-tRNA synthetase